jgi:choline dehydrogenase-like flavoprotein
MGRDAMSVVDGNLKVYGADGLRVADASILPRVTTGNTMAPCVVIGERAAALLRREDPVGVSGAEGTSATARASTGQGRIRADATRSEGYGGP